MTEALAETPKGSIAINANLDDRGRQDRHRDGSGAGPRPRHQGAGAVGVSGFAAAHGVGRRLADAAGVRRGAARGRVRVLTPHPGEMARLTGKSTAEVQKDRVGAARGLRHRARRHLVLKGQRTVIAFPDGRVWINPTGTPALGTGGTRRHPDRHDLRAARAVSQTSRMQSVAAAVYLRGLAGEIGARELGEKCLVATDMLKYPSASHGGLCRAYRTASEAETIALGERLARELPARAVVLLIGNLGAGKTTLAKGIVNGLGARRPTRSRARPSP